MLSISALSTASAQGTEWTEKDLARSVHRAEQTFQGGEMSRAYGLFAHLVSVAGDRAFLHYRFGATCTFTSQRLDEAKKHLEIARELGILESEYQAGWHYYMARYHQSVFAFDEAAVNLRTAIDLASNKDAWLEDAKLRFGQCTNNADFSTDSYQLQGLERLVSHSDDYFRLYEMPVSEGRLLVIPEHLQTKEDKRREYTAQLHWLPGHRYAFYASYGKDGDTGLDIYRVAVNGVGEYGEPERLPFPVNSDFDDCAPICIPSADDLSTGRLYFSSSRPQSLGGFDIFKVDGALTSEAIELVQSVAADQLPFEINSTADEFLYWENVTSKEAWLTTNRNQDFEGREVWRFDLLPQAMTPVAVSFKSPEEMKSGKLNIASAASDKVALSCELAPNSQVDVVLPAGETLEIIWEANDGSASMTEQIKVPMRSRNGLITDPVILSVSGGRPSLQAQLDGNTMVDQPAVRWSFDGMSNRVHAGILSEAMNADEYSSLKARSMHNVGIEKVLQAANSDGSDGDEIPSWMLEAMQEIGVATVSTDLPVTVTKIRQEAVGIQAQMEKTMCWDAPGTEGWKVQAAIERYGEPALALLSEEVRQLRMQAQNEQDVWGVWSDAITEYIYQTGVDSEDWNVMLAFCEAQFQAFAGAYVHAEDMFRRIDSHLRFERWLAEALPMNIEVFRGDLLALLAKRPALTEAFASSAAALKDGNDGQALFNELQSEMWAALTDDIIAFQELGIYTLPGMEKTQAWFLRSGGIMEELNAISDPRERLSKGQQAVGLAWETYREGANRYEQVIAESEISPGSWWQSFGPATPNGGTEGSDEYAGYEMFIRHDDPILDQAHAYQRELDILRTSAKHEEAYTNSLKSALIMRSSIQDEMLALFGGERVNNTESQPEAMEPASVAPVGEETKVVPAEPVLSAPVNAAAADIAVPEEAEVATAPMTPAAVLRYTVQVGAFANAPNFDEMPSSEEVFVLASAGRLTKYGSGKFANHAAAKQHLIEVQKWAPDAFIKPIQIAPTTPVVEAKKTVVPQPAKADPVTDPARPAPAAKSSRTKEFRVRIVSYETTLEPAEVATLLRLGNEVPLKTARLTNQTVYFTDTFESLEDAKSALDKCLKRGFGDAEIEVIYQ